jgi:hypothetical protein
MAFMINSLNVLRLTRKTGLRTSLPALTIPYKQGSVNSMD